MKFGNICVAAIAGQLLLSPDFNRVDDRANKFVVSAFTKSLSRLSLSARATKTAQSLNSIAPIISSSITPLIRKSTILPLSMTESSTPSSSAGGVEDDGKDDEIARLKAMAQKLRSEAAALEAEQAEERAEVARIAFEKFDANTDGKISTEELKSGLEQSLKLDGLINDDRIAKLMKEFDLSGDGYLQLDEMVSVDQFRNKLEAYAREEKRLAREAAIGAQKEEEMAKLAEAKLAILNDKDPTQRDKIVSILPYLFPLLDSLQFGRFLINDNVDNPIVGILAVLFVTYRSIPFSGFLAFLALNTLSSNPGLNKLVRFNMQQSIFLDIALFFPGLIGALIVGIGGAAGFQIDDSVSQLSSTAIFGLLVLTVLYASISSLLGITPDKIPFISRAVEDRMPTTDMFDDQGRFIPRSMRPPKEEDKSKDGDDSGKK